MSPVTLSDSSELSLMRASADSLVNNRQKNRVFFFLFGPPDSDGILRTCCFTR